MVRLFMVTGALVLSPMAALTGLTYLSSGAQAARCPTGQIYRVSKKTCMNKAAAIKAGFFKRGRVGKAGKASVKSSRKASLKTNAPITRVRPQKISKPAAKKISPDAGTGAGVLMPVQRPAPLRARDGGVKDTAVKPAAPAVSPAAANPALGRPAANPAAASPAAANAAPDKHPEFSPVPMRMVKPVYINPKTGQGASGKTVPGAIAPAAAKATGLGTTAPASTAVNSTSVRVQQSGAAPAAPTSTQNAAAIGALKSKLKKHITKNREKYTKRAVAN